MNLKPLADRVVLKRTEAEEKTKGGIILTSAAQEKPEVYEVIVVGPGGHRRQVQRNQRQARRRGIHHRPSERHSGDRRVISGGRIYYG